MLPAKELKVQKQDSSHMYNVLLVDDSMDYLMYMRRVFKRSNFHNKYTIETEQNCQEAIQKLKSNKYNLCLMDYHLKGRTGIDLLNECKEKGCHTAFIILTASNDESSVNEALLAGADDYLIKDKVDPLTLERSIRYALQRRQVEQITTDQQFKLGHASKMAALGELAASIVHEINNPLTVIRGSCMLAKNTLNTDKPDTTLILDKLKVIDDCTMRIAHIVRSLKSFSYNEEQLPPASIAIREILEKAISICQIRLKKENISSEVVIDGEGLIIECRENEILQVLINLINNSCDALEGEHNGWIKIEAQKIDDKVQILFTDSGNGVPLEVRDKILQPYFTTKKKGKGTGLGLSICKAIVENHGGRFDINFECKNTQFILEIPISYKPKLIEKNVFTILVAEDVIELREMIQEQLEFENVKVITAANGEAALKLLINETVDLIVTDVNMPILSGLEMVRQLETKNSYYIPPIIFITGQVVSSLNLEETINSKVTVFNKPIDFDELRAHIRKIMESKKNEHSIS